MNIKRFIKNLIGLGSIVGILNSCSMQNVDNPYYKIINKVSLQKDLKEISGLTYYKNGTFLAVQDELGLIYMLDEKSGDIIKEWKFGKKGDYEGITIANNMVYVLRSDGDLYRFDMSNQTTEKLNNPYIKKSEFEGLCFDQTTNRLILSCKSSHHSKLNKYLVFYGYDLNTNKWIEDPIIKINKDEVEALASIKFKTLKASGIVQHPINQNFYIVASLGSVIIELNSKYNLKRVIPLHDNFNQPEGITINSNGELVISNEANKKQNATIYTIVLK